MLICRLRPALSVLSLSSGLVPCALVLLMAAACFSCRSDSGSAVQERLQGTWISDREGTVAAMKENERWRENPEVIERVSNIFGKLTVTYKGRSVAAHMDEYGDTGILTVLSEAGAVADVEIRSTGKDRPEYLPEVQRYRISMGEDYYWLEAIDGSGIPERFIRLQGEAPEAGNSKSAP